MPDWTRPADMRFDHEAASALLAEIELGLTLVDTVVATLGSATRDASERWSGRLHDRVDADVRRWCSELSTVHGELRTMAARVIDATADAVAEAAAVARLQDRWDAERAAEVRALLTSDPDR